ncbi:hypothetical protein FHR81_004889 [Actinoalloteichus hoggarensis]|uniref:Uncharacterized protein n=1 Tax=Actinoalloteichus hoggarensis TaxID=1470176 RepID=A0A221W7Z9_9PSEU|nr:hypothetical protein [Actinoalloteichus hoggarensis]ASO22102.1 hypothetical protein AHOG_22445 [Actinoalloteichus hoggarensis]MBB5923816.1 hypothetical protein [Actinoalloteichus hoggarensis]
MTTRSTPTTGNVLTALIRGLRAVLIGYWAVLIVVVLAIWFVAFIFGASDAAGTAGWSFSNPPKYFLLATGVMLPTIFLPMFLIHGVTRRRFLVDGGIFAVLVSAAFAVAHWIGLLIEGFLLGTMAVDHQANGAHLFDSRGQVLLVLLEFGVLGLVHLLAGVIIGAAFYRLGWLRGLFLIPVALLPVVVTELTMATGWVSGAVEALGLTRLSAVVGTPIVLLSILAAAGGCLLLIRDLPVRSA